MKREASELSPDEWEKLAALGAEEVETPRFFDSHRWHMSPSCTAAGRCEEIATSLYTLADDLCCATCVDVGALSDAEYGMLRTLEDLKSLEADSVALSSTERSALTYFHLRTAFSIQGNALAVEKGLELMELPAPMREHVAKASAALRERAEAILLSEASKKVLATRLGASMDEEEHMAFLGPTTVWGDTFLYRMVFSAMHVGGDALVRGPFDVMRFLVHEGVGSMLYAPHASAEELETALGLWSIDAENTLHDAADALDAAQRV